MTDLEGAMAIIRRYESCRLQAYRDIVGVLTIGWGHTGPDVFEGQVIDQLRADTMLLEDLARVAGDVQALLMVSLNHNQFDALVSFAYNVGSDALARSTLLRRLNQGENPKDVAAEFLRWDYAGGREVEGLEARRRTEMALFLS